jgi:hypothetical protein
MVNQGYQPTKNVDGLLDKFSLIKTQLLQSKFRSHKFNDVPPIIGFIVADQYGNAIMVYEYETKDNTQYGPIKSYLSENDKNLLEIDLISMYFSSFKVFAGQTNIQNLSHLEIYGSNIKAQIYFLFDYIIITFLNSNTDLKAKEKKNIMDHFREILSEKEYEFTHFNESKAKQIIVWLENKGKLWLKKINNTYIDSFKKYYLKRHEIFEFLIEQIEPIIQNEVNEYLENIPEEIRENLTKEIKNKIQDKMLELNSNLI